MPTITPISDLRNYGGVPERVAPGSPAAQKDMDDVWKHLPVTI